MPGQLPLEPRYYPHDFATTTVTPPLSNSGGTGMQSIPLLYADRDLVIDSIHVYFPTAIGANATFTAWVVTDAAIPTGTASATQLQLSDGLALTTGGTYPSRTGLAIRATGPTGNNYVPAGSTVWLRASAVFTTGITIPFQIQVRWRTQV